MFSRWTTTERLPGTEFLTRGSLRHRRSSRKHGIAVVIVTGRILADLERAAGDLHFVDAVVAENGAVMWFANGHSRQLSYSTSTNFFMNSPGAG